MKRWQQVGFGALAVLVLAACSSKEATRSDNSTSDVPAGEVRAMVMGDGWSSAKAEASVGVTVHFAFDDATVTAADRVLLRPLANALMAHTKARLRIEGHADTRGSREYNVGLGWRRAKAVYAVLIAMGVSASQMEMVSYGAEKPVAMGHDAAAHQQNRRVELMHEGSIDA